MRRAVAAALTSGCDRKEVNTYRVPRAEAQQGEHFHGDGHDHSHDALVPSIEYKTPEGWEEVPPGQMRAASFRIKGEGQASADVGVFPLPGLAGSDLDNVNRWRGQVGLEPVKQEELAGLTETLEVGGQKAQLYDLAGENVAAGEDLRILAAIVRRDGVAWFFKMTGSANLVETQKDAFKELLQSVEFTMGPATAQGRWTRIPNSRPPIRRSQAPGMGMGMGLPPSHPPVDGMGLPPSHPPIGRTAGAAATDGASANNTPGKPAWKVPSGWTEVPGGQFLAAKFQIKGESNSEASVNVSVSSGDGGGVAGTSTAGAANLASTFLPAEKLGSPESPGRRCRGHPRRSPRVDPQSNRKTRVIGLVAPDGNRTWFYKLMGDEAVVEREKDPFVEFVKGAIVSKGALLHRP
jgi:hypothetical protein